MFSTVRIVLIKWKQKSTTGSARHVQINSPTRGSPRCHKCQRKTHTAACTEAPASSASNTSCIIYSILSRSCTTNILREVTVSQNNVVPISKSKCQSALRISERSDIVNNGSREASPWIGGLEPNEDDSLEHAAALASPFKGRNSQAMTKVNLTHSYGFLLTCASSTKGHVKVMRGEEHHALLHTEEMQFKGIILPYWIQFRMAQDDPWTELSQVDLDFIKQY